MNNVVEEIKNRVDIVDLISQYVPLKRRGENYFGLCPFHSEKTPSFSVNPKGNFFHCFGCGESGDVITFFMKIENMEFKDAIKELARRYGIEIKQSNGSVKENPLILIHKEAAEFFHKSLQKSRTAVNYLNKRGLNKEAIDKFKIGYAPKNSELFNILSKKYSKDKLILSGIFANGSNGLYNRFSGRIIFPIDDERGNTIAFGGRIMENDATKAKYINSPETEIFSKQRVLYGLSKAKESMRKNSSVIITEGYLDCIRLHLNGINYAVATLGTALSKYHLTTIKRYSKTLYFNYDSDNAGLKAMMRNAPILLESGLELFIVVLENKDDPDSFIMKNGLDAYKVKLEKSINYFDYIIKFLKQKYNMSNPQEKIEAVQEIKPLILNIKNPIARSAYISKVASEFKISDKILIKREKVKGFFQIIDKEDAILSLLLKDIELFVWIDDANGFAEYFSGDYKLIYLKLLDYYMSGEDFVMEKFEKGIDGNLKNNIYRLLALEHTDIEERYERRKVFLYLLRQFEIKKIKKELKNIENLLSQKNDKELLKRYNEFFMNLKQLMQE